MTPMTVTWMDGDKRREGVLVAFVHTSLKDVVGIVLVERSFTRVPYQDLVFTP